MYDKYVLSLGHRVCSVDKGNLSFMQNVSDATVYSTIGDAMREASNIVGELGVNVTVKRLE